MIYSVVHTSIWYLVPDTGTVYDTYEYFTICVTVQLLYTWYLVRKHEAKYTTFGQSAECLLPPVACHNQNYAPEPAMRAEQLGGPCAAVGGVVLHRKGGENGG